MFGVRLEFLQNLNVSRIASFLQGGREALRVVPITFIEIRTKRARVRSGPQHEAYPLHVPLAAEVPESTIRLLLQRGRQFRARPLQFEERAERSSDLVAEMQPQMENPPQDQHLALERNGI